jgi:hypothetical protein
VNAELSTPVADDASRTPRPVDVHDVGRGAKRETRARRLLRIPVAIRKLCFGALFGTSFVLSFLVVGWAQRVARREVAKSWWKRARRSNIGPSFADFAAGAERTRGLVHWPDWFLGPSQPRLDARSNPSRLPRWSHRFLGSFVNNAKFGVQSTFNTFVLLLPGTGLWAIGWFFGWQISFDKVYEHFAVGRSLFIAGTLWFCAAMFYVPLAQARQASTGDWRAFYQFGLVARCARKVWLQNCGLALLALALSIPAMILKTAPTFWPQMSEALRDLPPAQQLQRIESYFLLVAFYGVPAFVYFRMVAARVYARAVVLALHSGAIGPDQLSDDELDSLNRLGLLQPRASSPRHWISRFLRSLSTRAGRIVAGLATFLIWLLFVFNIMTHEFFNHHAGGRGWLNQPTLELPWFDYTPNALREAAKNSK